MIICTSILLILVNMASILYYRKKYHCYSLKLGLCCISVTSLILITFILSSNITILIVCVLFYAAVSGFFAINQLIMGYTNVSFFHRNNLFEVVINLLGILFWLAVTNHLFFAIFITEVMYMLLGLISYLVLKRRGTEFEVGDIAAISTAKTIIKKYKIHPDSIMLLGCFIEIIQMAGIFVLISLKEISISIMPYVRVALIIAVVAIIGMLLFTPILQKCGLQYRAIENGMGVCSNLVLQVIEMVHCREKRVDFEKAKVELQKCQVDEKNEGILPNILVIMNESFADLRCYDIERDVNIGQCYENIDKLVEQGMKKGWAYSSVYGGNTAYAEFEFLTGCSTRFVVGCPYSAQNIKNGKKYNTLVSNLKDLGYKTIATHPYKRNNWRRPIIYSAFGFDEQLYQEELNCEKNIRGYASDSSYYKRLIEKYTKESNGNNKMFSFNITMQNHGGYLESGDMTLEDIAKMDELNVYLNLVKKSDKAFGELVAFFSQQDYPTAILLFGDHQPKLCEEFYEKYAPKETFEQEEKYKVPFYIWSNFEMNELQEQMISLNYLFEIFSSAIGLPDNSINLYLAEACKKYPIITKKMMKSQMEVANEKQDNDFMDQYMNVIKYFGMKE